MLSFMFLFASKKCALICIFNSKSSLYFQVQTFSEILQTVCISDRFNSYLNGCLDVAVFAVKLLELILPTEII